MHLTCFLLLYLVSTSSLSFIHETIKTEDLRRCILRIPHINFDVDSHRHSLQNTPVVFLFSDEEQRQQKSYIKDTHSQTHTGQTFPSLSGDENRWECCLWHTTLPSLWLLRTLNKKKKIMSTESWWCSWWHRLEKEEEASSGEVWTYEEHDILWISSHVWITLLSVRVLWVFPPSKLFFSSKPFSLPVKIIISQNYYLLRDEQFSSGMFLLQHF